MYSNEKNPGLNWKDLIIKAIFLVVFILLMVWLFPKVPNMTAFYSNIFRENISYMQDAAESYYTNERLPKNVGDTAEMTLQEMIDKNLILPFVDKDGNACDTKASYVQITKNKTDYTLTVNLVCPTEKNKVNKILGCHDYCENCKEEIADVEYQFKKAVTSNQTVYSCPNGGTLSGTTCVVSKLSNSYKATGTTVVGSYYCPNGGTLNGTTCVVSNQKSYDAYIKNGESNYTCPNGGVLSGTTCYITDTATSSYRATATTGATTYAATASTTNGSYNATWTTSSSRTYAATASTTPTTSYAAKATSEPQSKSGYYTSKPQGYTCDYGLAPTSCSTCSMYKSYYYNCKATKTTYSCPNGGSLDNTGKTCVVPGKTTYSCPNGGTLSGQTCVVSGVSGYTCPQGGYLSGTKCITSGTTTYTCPQGGTLSGQTCITSATRYTCPSGGTLSGNMCYVSNNTQRTYAATYVSGSSSLYCNNGDTYSNGKCYYTENYTYNASKYDNKTTYTCPSGGTLSGVTCNIYTSSTYNATATSKLVTTYDYQWSKNETLDGYVKTGETRKIEA